MKFDPNEPWYIDRHDIKSLNVPRSIIGGQPRGTLQLTNLTGIELSLPAGTQLAVARRLDDDIVLPQTASDDKAGSRASSNDDKVNMRAVNQSNKTLPINSIGSCDSATACLTNNACLQPFDEQNWIKIREEMMETMHPSVEEKIRERLREILNANWRAFSQNEHDIGLCTRYQHRLTLREGTSPVIEKVRRLSPLLRQTADVEIDKMLQMGIIQEAKVGTQWCNNILLVPKRSGDGKQQQSFRCVLDLRATNLRIKPDSFPVPQMAHVMHNLSSAFWYFRTDIYRAYESISLHPDSRPVMSFRSWKNHFSYCRLVQGCIDASNAWNRVAMLLLKEINSSWVLAYADDFILGVPRDQLEQGLQIFQEFLEKIQQFGLKLKPSKCVLLSQQVEMCGFLIKEQKVYELPSHIEAILKIPTPKSKREIRKFIGCVNYTRGHHYGIAMLLRPLNNLLRGSRNGRIPITPSYEAAFQKIKSEMATQPFLFLFNPSQQVILQCDASQTHWSAALFNEDEQKNRYIVGYQSGRFTEPQSRLCIATKEAIAVKNALTRYRHMILGCRIRIESDNQVVVSLMKVRDIGARLFRMTQLFSEFGAEFKLISTKDNVLADFLSRNQLHDELPIREICSIANPCSECLPIRAALSSETKKEHVAVENASRQLEVIRTSGDQKFADARQQTAANTSMENFNRSALPRVAPGGIQQSGAAQMSRRDATGPIGTGEANFSSQFGETQGATLSQGQFIHQRTDVRHDSTVGDPSSEAGISNVQHHQSIGWNSQRLSTVFETDSHEAGSEEQTGSATAKDAANSQTVSHVRTGGLRLAGNSGTSAVATTAADAKSGSATRGVAGCGDISSQAEQHATCTPSTGGAPVQPTIASAGDEGEVTQQAAPAAATATANSTAHRLSDSVRDTTPPTGRASTVGAHADTSSRVTTAAAAAPKCKGAVTSSLNRDAKHVLPNENPTVLPLVGEAHINILTRGKGRLQQADSNEPLMITLLLGNKGVNWSLEMMAEKQQADPALKIVHTHLVNGTKPSEQEVLDHLDLPFWVCQWESLEIKENVIYRQHHANTGDVEFLQYATPPDLRKPLMEKVHADILLHSKSYLKNIHELRKLSCWQYQARDLRIFLKECVMCAAAHGRKERPLGKIACRQHDARIMNTVFFDHIGPLTATPSGEKYVLTLQEQLSRRYG
jgi:hypothetical protein